MRILKGYSKDEQKELEEGKQKYMNGSDLLQIMTGFPLDMNCGLIWQKYDKSEKDEQISIIRDILDFYTDKAKFPENKYVVHDKVTGQYIYYNVTDGLYWGQPHSGKAVTNTKEEWLTINPAYEPMLEKL